LIKKRVGIFGGTFNPPHIGHVRAAEAFSRQMKLDELLIIPDYLPPHKEYMGNVSALDRLNMCRAAFDGLDSVTVSDMEIKRGGRSYTYITLEELASDDRQLYLLVGTDMFLTLDSWVKPEIIFRLADICYMRRETEAEKMELVIEKKEQYIERNAARIHEIVEDVTVISSTEIRSCIRTGTATEKIPQKVLDYIKRGGLYCD